MRQVSRFRSPKLEHERVSHPVKDGDPGLDVGSPGSGNLCVRSKSLKLSDPKVLDGRVHPQSSKCPEGLDSNKKTAASSTQEVTGVGPAGNILSHG